MEKQLKVEEGKLARLEEELQAKAAAAASVQNRFSYKVRDMVIDSCPETYLITTKDGRSVEKLHAINRDSTKLEKLCKGKPPRVNVGNDPTAFRGGC